MQGQGGEQSDIRADHADRVQLLYRQAAALQFERRLDEAAALALKAVTLAPKNGTARLKLAEILLSRGEFGPGWLEYERGLRLADKALPRFPVPRWNGMNLKQGRVL